MAQGMYDAIVIGARCAGAVTAMLLARRGHRVLLLDRGVIPSDVHQGHFIHKQGPKLLADWGLLEKVVDTKKTLSWGLEFATPFATRISWPPLFTKAWRARIL